MAHFHLLAAKWKRLISRLQTASRREKNEEIGSQAIVRIAPNESFNVLFRKNDGNSMILPHIAAVFQSGEIALSDEYSEYRWVSIDELEAFQPKIENIPELVEWAAAKLATANDDQLVEI